MSELDDVVDVDTAAELLMVEPEQIHALVAGGLLVPVNDDGDNGGSGGPVFSRAAVLAARSVGG